MKLETLMYREEDAGGFGHRRHCSSVLEHRRIRLLDDRRGSMCDAPARAAGVFGILRGDAAIASGREKPGRETVSALRLARIWLAPEGVLGCGDGTAGAMRRSKRICLTARAISCANASVKRRRPAMRRSLRSLPRWLPRGCPSIASSTVARKRGCGRVWAQGLEDWLRVRFGRIGAVVDGVAFPETEDEVRDVLAWARGIGAMAIPVGGATSVVGHLTPKAGGRPSLAIVMT